VIVIVVVLALMLPMLAITLAAILAIELLILRRIAPVRRWLGLREATA
jgi:hypothetical protein